MNKEKIKLNKFWNKLIWANFFITYSLFFLILSVLFGKKAFIDDLTKMYANITCATILLSLSLFFSIFVTIRMNLYGQSPHYKKLMLYTSIAVNSIPLIGLILILIFKYKEINYESKQTKLKTKKKSVSSYTILFFLTLMVVLVIWIIYAINGKFEDADPLKPTVLPGILDVIIAPIKGFIEAASLIIFLLIIGAFLQVTNQSKALEAGIGFLVKKMHGKEIWLIPILMFLFSVGGTVFGMCEETLPFYLILIPVMLSAGFDVVTAMFVILFGAGLGVAGSILNPFVIHVAVDSCIDGGVPFESITVTSGIIWRIVSYLIILIVGTSFITFYGNKIKKNPSKSLVYDIRKEHLNHFKIDQKEIPVLTLKRKFIIWIFAITFLIMMFGVINWESLTGWDGFNKFSEWLNNYFPFISSISGIGQWYLIEMSFLFLTSSFIIGIITWKDEETFLNDLFIGAKDFLGVGLIIAIARGLSIILSNSGLNSILIDGLSDVINSMNAQAGILLIFVIFLLLSFLIPSTSGFASTVFPTLGPTLHAATNGLTISGGITAFSLANGWINIISPTSGPFMAACALSKMPLNKYYKSSWKLLLGIFITIIALMLIGTIVPKELF